MIALQDCKVEVPLATLATVATNSSNYAYLDTIGWDYAKIIAVIGTAATGNAAFKGLILTEGTNSTAASAIVAFTGGTVTSASVGFVIPNFTGITEPTCVVLNVNLKKRERYLRLLVTPGTAAPVSVVCVLGRGREATPGSDDGNAALIVDG